MILLLILLAFPVTFVNAEGDSTQIFVCNFEEESANMLIARYTNNQEAIKYILLDLNNREEQDSIYIGRSESVGNEYYGTEEWRLRLSQLSGDTLLFVEESGTRDRGHEDGEQTIYIAPNHVDGGRIAGTWPTRAEAGRVEEPWTVMDWMWRVMFSSLLMALLFATLYKVTNARIWRQYAWLRNFFLGVAGFSWVFYVLSLIWT